MATQSFITEPASKAVHGRPALSAFWTYLALLTLCFSPALYRLLAYSLKEELYSHILLIPVIAGYLIWQRRPQLPAPARGNWHGALLPALAAVSVLAFWFIYKTKGYSLSKNDSIVAGILPYYLFLVAGVLYFLGSRFAWAIAFPIAFGVFIVPFPDALANSLEIVSQHASAEVYEWMMKLTGATYYREGLTFALPGLNLKIAQECSGIRSSFVLFLTSLLAGDMFLRTGWKKALLAAIVIPLGFVRNAFRVLVLSLLTAHVSPGIIDSPLHHRGGPLFFLLSLIPFFALLLWLRKSERPGSSTAEKASALPA